jgi:LysM repeat protein
MSAEEFKGRSRNIRRGNRGTLVFRIVAGIALVGLLITLVTISGALGEARKEIEVLSERVENLPAGKLSDAQPTDTVVQKDYSADLEALTSSMEALRAETTATLTKSAEDLATSERAAAEERLGLTGKLDALKARIEARASVSPSPVPDGGADPVPPVPVFTEEEMEDVSEDDVPEPVPAPVETPEYEEYTVRSGDSISRLARRFKVDMDELLELNGITEAHLIRIGQVLKIPSQ